MVQYLLQTSLEDFPQWQRDRATRQSQSYEHSVLLFVNTEGTQLWRQRLEGAEHLKEDEENVVRFKLLGETTLLKSPCTALKAAQPKYAYEEFICKNRQAPSRGWFEYATLGKWRLSFFVK